MNTRFASLAAFSFALFSGLTMAQQAPSVVVAAAPVKPTMSYEVAVLMQQTQRAQAQYRRTGSSQDLARVKAMQIELARHGYGRSTQIAPVVQSSTEFAQPALAPVQLARNP
ncbi:MAG: hypothetical protein Fur007_11780 [Rhodoferax sp.]